MAFLPNFAHDVFISYAHVDDEEDMFGTRWVSTFVNDLRLSLAQLLGQPEKLDIYQDTRKLEAGHELDRLRQELRQSAVFLAVLSPSYLGRSWTMDEFRTFQSVAAGSGRAVLIDKLAPTDSEESLPAEMRNIFRPKFYERAENATAAMSIGRGRQVELYAQRVADLADQIRRRFRDIATADGAATAAVAPDGMAEPLRPATGAAVLLGRVTDDLQKDREQLRRTLVQYDVQVIPPDDYPDDGARFKQRFLADLAVLKQASQSVFVQLVGPYPSKRPADLPNGYEAFQLEAARAAGVDVVQWRRNDINLAAVDDEQHAALLAGSASMTLEALKSEVLRLCQPPEPTKAAPVNSGDDFVFINSDQSDLDLARNLRGALRDRNFGVALPDFGGDLRSDLEQNLLVCDAVVFVYGQARPNWLRRQLLHYRKMLPDRRTPIRLVRIFNGPPQPKEDPDISLPEAREVASVDELIAHLTA